MSRSGGFTLEGPATPVRALVREVWRSRSLLAMLARKEFFVRYRRASFGMVWAVALPLFQAAVLAAVVSHFVRFDTGGDYALFVFAGTLAWSFFAGSLTAGCTAIVDNADMSAKVYLPRALFPLTSIGAGVYGLAISAVILVGFTVIVGEGGRHQLLLVPALVLVVLLATAGALLLAALQVYLRDVKYLLHAGLLPLFYLTPIFYPIEAVGRLRPWVEANPMTGVVELFRAATVGADPGWTVSLWWTAGWILVVGALAVQVHHRYDRVLSDLL